MTTQSATHETRTTAEPILNAGDRCDVCGARAWVRAVMAAASLHFCAHHARDKMDALRAGALEVIDERHLLLAEEGSL